MPKGGGRQGRPKVADPGRERTKAQRRAASLPADDGERGALLRKQIVVRGLAPGALDEKGVGIAVDKAFERLPAFDAAGRPACERVQMYAGGTYAFVTLRDAALAATAPRLPSMSVEGVPLRITRVRECEHLDDAAIALPVPCDLDLSDIVSAAAAASGVALGAHVGLETKLFWTLRHHRCNPRPNDKEVKESLAFFKKSEKLLGRRKLVVDCCGSHGMLAALFVAFGRAREAVVLDLHQPASFENLCAHAATHASAHARARMLPSSTSPPPLADRPPGAAAQLDESGDARRRAHSHG